MGKLVLVPTPIGNLKDISFRAIEYLKSADVILAEDTRVSGKLLNHYEIKNKMIPFHQHNEHKKVEQIIELLKEKELICMITDAGTPGISDPGFLLVREALNNNIQVETLPGATAFVPALVNSGLPADRFIFEGFLPQKKGRQTRLKEISENKYTSILYESPHRLVKTLSQLKELCGGERLACVSREISKLYEENTTASLEELIKKYSETTVKGEIVLILSAAN
jgi:16S rRNA (cytidine1402-2'-O)-methyltransferase